MVCKTNNLLFKETKHRPGMYLYIIDIKKKGFPC